MTISDMVKNGIVTDWDVIRIVNQNHEGIVGGWWFSDNVLDYLDHEVEIIDRIPRVVGGSFTFLVILKVEGATA